VTGLMVKPLPIPARDLRGTGRTASVIALGTSSFGTLDRAAPVYDQYTECGGNFFDTAWVYGLNYEPGCCERVLGAWMKKRGVSDRARVLIKGGHPPHCSPQALGQQLLESLDRLQLAQADLYMLHRDDTSVAVGEFVDVLRSFVNRGLARTYGFSNWTTERVAEAITYARRHDYPEPVALSNQLSLAVMEQPIYPGCVDVSDIASRQWLEQNKLTLIPWASQGRGVFTSVTSEAEFRASDLASSWFSTANWRRIERAQKLASDRGILPVNIALAWVLHQPFPTFPIIGPRTTAELETSLCALDVPLSDKELAWLNIEPWIEN